MIDYNQYPEGAGICLYEQDDLFNVDCYPEDPRFEITDYGNKHGH